MTVTAKKDRPTMADAMERYLGQPVAIFCCRFWYRGILKELGENYALLVNPRMVEDAGAAATDKPRSEDAYPSDLIVALEAVEMVSQPAWCWHEMEMTPPVPAGGEAAKKSKL